MNETSKEAIERIISNECDDDIDRFEKLMNLVNKMNESQLKELEGYLYITQVSTYQTTCDYAEELEII